MNKINLKEGQIELKDVELKDVELIKEKDPLIEGQINYYFSITYIRTDEFGKQEINYPRVYLPIFRKTFYTSSVHSDSFLDIGLGELPLKPGPDGKLFTLKQVEEYPQEMTLEEIESRLGHKIKIISIDEKFRKRKGK